MKFPRWIRWTWRDLVDATYRRIKYGCNPQDIWNLDTTCARWLVPRLKLMRDRGHGFPGEIYAKYEDMQDRHEADRLAVAEWRGILDEMIDGFSMIATKFDWMYLSKPEYDANWEKANRALDLFRNYYFDLWD